jgi:hypothetical protein
VAIAIGTGNLSVLLAMPGTGVLSGGDGLVNGAILVWSDPGFVWIC